MNKLIKETSRFLMNNYFCSQCLIIVVTLGYEFHTLFQQIRESKKDGQILGSCERDEKKNCVIWG